MSAPQTVLGSLLDQCPTPVSPPLRELEDRLAALKLLSGRLAHDYNNFLAPVLGYTALIKEELPRDSSAMSYAVALEQSARRTGELLEEILLAARPQGRVRRKEGNFTELVERELDEWEESLQSSARISVARDLDQVRFMHDAKIWRIALGHLLSNVRFALATGGKLEVALKPQSLSSAQKAELGVLGNKHFRLSFRDHGFGMSPQVLAKAFDPFFTTRPKTYGRGLGLTIVHTVARAHGGQATLASREEEGATVDLWFPVDVDLPQTEAESKPEAGKTAEEKPPRRKKKEGKILVVDDDPYIVEVLQTYLQNSDYHTLVARDGVEGLKAFKRNAKKIILVISDVSMPNMDGIEMTMEIRKQNPEMPILFMSGAPEVLKDETVFFQVASPRHKLLKKPFALKELMDMVVKLVQ